MASVHACSRQGAKPRRERRLGAVDWRFAELKPEDGPKLGESVRKLHEQSKRSEMPS